MKSVLTFRALKVPRLILSTTISRLGRDFSVRLILFYSFLFVEDKEGPYIVVFVTSSERKKT